MMKFLLVLIFGVASLSSYAQIINIYSLGNGQMKVVGQGFIARGTQNYFINYWKNDRRIGSGNTTLSGSFEYVSGAGVFKKGDRLIVKVMNFKGSGSHFVRSAEYAETPRKDNEITDERIQQYATKQANRVANRVKNTLVFDSEASHQSSFNSCENSVIIQNKCDNDFGGCFIGCLTE